MQLKADTKQIQKYNKKHKYVKITYHLPKSEGHEKKQTPEIQVIDARIEKGFQLSGLDHSDYPGTSDIEGTVETSSIYC